MVKEKLRFWLWPLVLAGFTQAAAGAEPDPVTRAGHILRTAGLKGGVIAHLECGDGKLTAELGRGRRFIVHGMSTNGEDVDRARAYIRSQGLYGRVSVERGSFERLPYAASLINLVLAEDGAMLLAKGLSPEEVFRVLVPRGIVCLESGTEDAAEKEIKERMQKAGFEELKTIPHETGRLLTWRKPKPEDVWAGPPRNLQWLLTEYYRGGDSSSACGRIYNRVELPWGNDNGAMVVSWRAHSPRPGVKWGTVGPYRVDFPIAAAEAEPPKNRRSVAVFVVARDAHNGRILWIRALEHWYRGAGGRRRGSLAPLDAVGELVYTLAEEKLMVLNGATGELVRTYQGLPRVMPRVHQGMLLFFEGDFLKRSLVAADAETGKVLWQALIGDVQLGDGAVFGRKGGKKGPLVCLDLKTGAERWSREDVKGTLWACGNGVLVTDSRGGLQGLSCEDGKSLWDKKFAWGAKPCRWWTHGETKTWANNPPAKNPGAVPQPIEKPYYNKKWVYSLEGRIWVSGFQEYANPRVLPIHDKPTFSRGRIHFHGYDPYHWEYDPRIVRTMFCAGIDPLTGEEVARFDYPKDIPLRDFGCSFPQGKARFIHGEPRGLMDVREGKWLPVPGARAACGGTGYYLGEGLTFATPTKCDQYGCAPGLTRRGYMAVAPVEWETAWKRTDRDSGRLEQGPAFGKVSPGGGEVAFSIDENRHLVEARDAGSKGVRWRFTAAGRIDTPPVICQGVALLGARDGYVYALRVSDGALVWRFRAAPRERRVVAYDQLESAWPIVGGVLVADGTAYFVAGLTSEFSEGVMVYAVEPKDGTIVWKKRFDAKGGTSYKGGPSWGDVVIAERPVRDGTRLIIPGRRNLPVKAKPVRPVDGLGGKILDLKTGKIEKPVGGRFYKVCGSDKGRPGPLFIFDGKLKIWRGLEE